MDKTYIYDGTEVVLTGRQAHREGGSVKTRSRVAKTVDVLVEIKPLNEIQAWTKWVRMKELYEVVNVNTKEEE